MTFYAQMARSYALETMFATIATYLLFRAWPDGRWRWWLAYAAAVALTGLLNMFGLLILAAHGVTLLASARWSGAHGQAAAGRRIGPIPLRWLAAAVAAVAVLSPLLALARHQQQQISWLARPDYRAIERLLSTTAGSRTWCSRWPCSRWAAWRPPGSPTAGGRSTPRRSRCPG